MAVLSALLFKKNQKNSFATLLKYLAWFNKSLAYKQDYIKGHLIGYVNKVAIEKVVFIWLN